MRDAAPRAFRGFALPGLLRGQHIFRGVTGPKTVQAKQCSPLGLNKKKSTVLPAKYSAFLVENSGDRLNIALIRSIHQKGSQLHPASRNHAPPTRQFYHPIFKCVNGFCSERRSFTRKVFSDSLLSAILILHIKVALFIFPKSIDKEVFSTMPMYYRCFLSMNQPHDP